MAQRSSIEWTDATWNPWHGCRKVSPGCKNCYMFREKRQYGQEPTLVVRSKTKFRDPLKWKEPALVFTCSWSDFFIEEADAWRDEAWDIIRATPHLTYQILTKRIERAAGHLPSGWPFKNVWLGVSVEDQANADKRIPELLRIPAAVRFLSVEPLIGQISLAAWLPIRWSAASREWQRETEAPWIANRVGVDWVIVGGESGPKARPMHPDWARSVRDQCVAAGIPFFFKQWGEWAPMPTETAKLEALPQTAPICLVKPDGRVIRPYCGLDTPGAQMVRLGKKTAGRLLEGREWNEFPETSA